MARIAYSGIPILQDRTVIGLFGEAGSGKSAVLAKTGIRDIKAGRKVHYCPEDFQLAGGHPISVLELARMDPEKLRGSTLLLDEMQVILSKWQMGSTRSFSIRSYIQHLRKYQVNVYYTTNAPEALDTELEDQTSFHGWCTLVKDTRCEKTPRQEHLKHCRDYVLMQMVDTHSKYGRVMWADGRLRRKRKVYVVRNLISVYSQYNTLAVQDPLELMGITKDVILGTRAEEDAGITTPQLVDVLRDIYIPELVRGGYDQIMPGAFSPRFNDEETRRRGSDVNVKSQQMGYALQELGLEKQRQGRGVVYHLPPVAYLEDWKNGLWTGIAV